MREPEYISVTDAAEPLGVTRQRVIQLIRAGRLPAQKIANNYVIRKDDLESFHRLPPGRPVLTKPKKKAATPDNGKRKEK